MSKGKNIEREKCRKHIYWKDSSLFIIENLEIKETCFISYVNTNIDENKNQWGKTYFFRLATINDKPSKYSIALIEPS